MNMLQRFVLGGVVAAGFSSCSATAVFAQSANSTLAFEEQRDRPGVDGSQNPLIVERVKTGFVIAPDFKVTEMNETFSKLAGAYGGWLIDKKLLVGGGAYWLTNQSDVRKMTYGGLMVGWLERTDRRIGFAAKGLVGIGRATLTRDVIPSTSALEIRDSRLRGVRLPRISGRPARLLFRDDFFTAEPQANVLVKITNWLRLDGGVGYRVIGGADGFGDELRGVTGNLAFQFGGS